MTLHARERPVFDYDGALELARNLYAFSDHAKAVIRQRNGHRDEALAGWRGSYGRQFADRAQSEDWSMREALLLVEADAWSWAEAWLVMVNNLNHVLYAEARDAQMKYLESKSSGGLFGSIGDAVSDGWDYFFGSDESFDNVHPPRTFHDPPSAPTFEPERPSFASYRRQGDSLVISYVHTIPTHDIV